MGELNPLYIKMKNLQIHLIDRPQGLPTLDIFKEVETEVQPLQDGQFIVKNNYISLDPAIRGWMNAGTTYIPGMALNAPIRAFTLGEIVDSKNDDFPIGTFVNGLLGVQEYAISDGKGVSKVDIAIGKPSWHLGILGMPGMTAYFGLLERGQPKAGETVFITGAAGIIGTTVGQIAKLKGCRVVGTAGSDEKCNYLKTIGFDVVINYKTENIAERLVADCPEKISILYDNVGGEQLDIGLAHLAMGARVVICGAISQYNNASIQGPKNYMKIVTARGYITGIIVFDYLNRYPEAVAQMSDWLTEGVIETKEDIYDGIKMFPSVLLKLFSGENFGKLLIKT
jgi:NADPH-dependent curcumin reductase